MKTKTLWKQAMLRLSAGILILTATARGQTLEVLHVFQGADGANPWSCALVQGLDGSFYGGTGSGGSLSLNGGFGDGTVFKIAPEGTLTTLVSFQGTNGAGLTGLVQGRDGNFYGTTPVGGDLSLNSGYGYGTVFKMTPQGVLTTLFKFKNDSNGAKPAGLIQGSDGSFYGTTAGIDGTTSYGTVFKITTDGTLVTLVHFNKSNGATPCAALVEGSDGNFYGTTAYGGGGYGTVPNGAGTVFKVTTNGVLTTLVAFDGNGGAVCQSSLVQGTDGNFYGDLGVAGPGFVFQVTATGDFTTLAWFDGSNGASPWAGLIQASDGNFYGTTRNGGDYARGTVFEMTPDGTLTTLVSLDFTNTGGLPEAPLVQGSDGNLYGTTFGGGNPSGTNTFGRGTIFRIVMPSAPTPPVLNIKQSGAQVVLSWPTNAVGFTLQSSPALGPSANWSDSIDSPVIVADQCFVTNATSISPQFYRLKK